MKEITLEEALKLVSFDNVGCQGWRVHDVKGDVKGYVNGTIYGYVNGTIYGNVYGKVGGDVDGGIGGNVEGGIGGNVYGDVDGIVHGNVGGNVRGAINGRKWKFVETPKDKLQRLITESGNQELIDTFNQLENNS